MKNRNNKAPGRSKAAPGSALIIILGGLAAILSTSTNRIEKPSMKYLLLGISAILIVICLLIIRHQRKSAKKQ